MASSSPTPPRTPTRSSDRRSRPPHMDITIPSSSPTSTHSRTYSSASSPSQHRPNHRRKSSSQSYAYSPTTPRTPGLSRRFSNAGEVEGESGLTLEEANGMGRGLGSLADELAEAWDEGEEADTAEGGDEDASFPEQFDGQGEADPHHAIDSGIDIPSSTSSPPTNKRASIQPHHPTSHHRHTSSTQLPPPNDDSIISPTLSSRLTTIEHMANTPVSATSDGVISRVLVSLRDLGPQSHVENGVTRLTTSHTSLSHHLHHQHLLLSRLTLPLLSPLSPTLPPQLATAILPLLDPLPALIPQPSLASLAALADLTSLTSSLVATLATLADTLHITAQTTALASRRLRSARELVAALRRDEDEVARGRRWIDDGGWEEKLARRWCGSECRGVMDGFGEVCDGWRKELEAGGVGA